MKHLLTILALLASSVQAQTITIPQQIVALPAQIPACVALNTSPAQTLCGPGLTVKATTSGCTTPQPATNTQTIACPAGTTGHWTQSQAYITSPAPTCWTEGPWSPSVAPTGACVPSGTAGVTWMYLNGAKTAAADFSGSTTNWFNATSAGYNGSKTDIKVSGGCFIPVWAGNYQLPNPGWSYFLIAMKPSSSNSVGIHFEPRVNGTDADIYPHINLADSSGKYGPAPQAGVWASYKIPLADLGVPPGTPLYKAVMACDGATYELDAIGFQ
jgi:hypothetical protein